MPSIDIQQNFLFLQAWLIILGKSQKGSVRENHLQTRNFKTFKSKSFKNEYVQFNLNLYMMRETDIPAFTIKLVSTSKIENVSTKL